MSQDTGANRPVSPAIAGATTNKDRTLLIADDDAAFRNRIARALEQRGFIVTAVGSVAEALAQTARPPAFAVLDLRLGDGVPATAPIQVRSPEIVQGIGNIVQNAVSFARHEVRIATRWTTEWSQVEVSDDGPGFSEALLDELGTPFISTRQGEEGHMGLGVFIAKTLLERTGAAVTFGNRSSGEGGAAVSVRWSNPVFKAT